MPSQAYCRGVLPSPKGWVSLFWSLWHPRQWLEIFSISPRDQLAVYWTAVAPAVKMVGRVAVP